MQSTAMGNLSTNQKKMENPQHHGYPGNGNARKNIVNLGIHHANDSS